MPHLAAISAAAIAAAAPAGVTTAVATTAAATAAKVGVMATMKTIAFKALTNLAISAAMSALQPQVGASGRPVEWTLDPDGPIPFAAGRVGVAGAVVHKETFGPDLMYYGLVSVLSGAGPIDGFETFKGDDEIVTFDANGKAISSQWRDEMWLRRSHGWQPDLAITSPPGLKRGAMLPGWSASHKLSGKAAYMLVMGENSKGSAYPMGEVKPLQVMRGLRCWDPRLDSTYPGGSGPCRLSDPDTWVYSANPYIWAIKWSLGLWEGPTHKGAPAHGSATDYQVGGIGAKLSGIDLPTLVAGANIADANGWTCAAYPTTDDDKSAVLDSFLQAGGAIYAQRAGKISCIQRAAPRTSIVTISAADTAGPIEIDTAASRIDRINTIRPRYWSEAHRWQLTALDDVTASEYRAEDGGTRPRPLDFHYVTNARQTAQLAALQITHTREGIAGVIPLKPHLQRIKPGDAFTITEPGFVLNDVKCLCLNTEFDPATKVVRVTFVSETDAKYAWALGQSATPPTPPVLTPVDPTFVSPPEAGDWTITPRPPSSGGGQLPGFDLSGVVSNETATAIIVEYGPSATGPWKQAYQGPPTVTNIPLDGLQPGAVYYVAIRYQRNQNYSEPEVYGPYTAPALEPSHLKGEPVQNILDRLVGVEAISASNEAAVSDLEEVYGDTVSAAQSALAAGEAANLAVLKAGEAGSSANAANTSAGIATTKADEAGNSATAANASKVAAESARDSASGSASAAATSASTASTKATDAGNSATAASGSATTASTAAGNALTYSNQASSARDDAVAASVAAGASAATAQSEAATSIEQKNLATAAAAEAAVNANLAARTGGGAINIDPAFSNYPADAQVPANWQPWGSMRDQARRTDGRFSPYAFQQHDNVDGVREDCGIAQSVHNVAKGYYVIEADVRLLAGGWRGAGVLCYMGDWGDGTSVTYNFGTEPDTNNQVGNVGTVVRSFRRLIHISDVANGVMTLHAMTGWQGGFGVVDPKIIVWDRCAIRPATEGEIAAGTVLPDVQAQLAITAAVAADSQSRLGSVSFDVTGGAGGAPFQIWGKAGPDGSMAGLVGTALILSNVLGTQVVEALKLIGGEAYFSAPVSVTISSRRLTIGPGFGVSNGLVLWFGPSSTAIGSMSRTNGYFALGTDGKVYYGAAELGGGGMSAELTRTYVVGSRSGAGSVTTPTTTIEVSGTSESVTYRWWWISGDTSLVKGGPSGSPETAQWSTTLTAMQSKSATWGWSATTASGSQSGIAEIVAQAF